MVDITLYEYGPTRSARVRWILLETGKEYTSIDEGRATLARPELKDIHPLKKMPAALIDNKPLFESAAITTYIADISPEANLIPASGTWSRALHDQWVFFAMTEIEAWLWSNFLNSDLLPDDMKLPEVSKQNNMFMARGLAALDKVLGETEYLVEDRFTVTDIIVSYTLNWARMRGHTKDFANIQAYLERLGTRPHCTLNLG